MVCGAGPVRAKRAATPFWLGAEKIVQSSDHTRWRVLVVTVIIVCRTRSTAILARSWVERITFDLF